MFLHISFLHFVQFTSSLNTSQLLCLQGFHRILTSSNLFHISFCPPYTADLSYSNGKLSLDLPEIDLIRERGGINIDSHFEVTGTFEEDSFDSNSTCYKLSSNGIEVKVICKRSKIFSFVEIPVSGSINPQYRGYDTLELELDLTK